MDIRLEQIVNHRATPQEIINEDSLERFTHRVSFADASSLPWRNIQHLHLFGKDSVSAKGIWPGIYVDILEQWALVVGAVEQDIHFYLSKCGPALKKLTVLDTELSELHLETLTGLHVLWMRGNTKLSKIRGLERLQALQEFTLSNSRLEQIVFPQGLEDLLEVALFDNKYLEEIHGLDNLLGLVNLSISDMPVERIPLSRTLPHLASLLVMDTPLRNADFVQMLPALERLVFIRAELSAPPLVKHHTSLKWLVLSFLPITSLDHVELPPSLELLMLTNCGISRVPETIKNLPNLQKLTLSNLKLESLPDWLPELGLTIGKGTDYGINLQGTTVEGVNMSVFDQSQEMILEWFEARKQENAGGPLNEIKVVFLGDGSTGKSLTVARLMQEQLGDSPEAFDGEATPGIAIADRELILPDGRQVQAHFWDFGGQEILHSMHRIFLTDRTLYIVMINARNNTQDDQARYWLHNVSSFAPGCPVLLVLNQIDQNPNASVNERSLKRLYPNLRGIVRLSALTFSREEFNRAFTEPLLEQIAGFDSLDAFFPTAWKQIMDKVRAMDGNYIRGDDFYSLCLESGVEGRDLCRDLLKWFHDIGVSFCCGGSLRLRDYVVLKPEWITNAIYTILWNKRSETANGMVDRDEIYRLLTAGGDGSVKQVRFDMTYKLEDVDYVLSISRQFRLSFPVDDMREFIPMLCGANALPEADAFLDGPGYIEFKLEYEYLPVNVLHRLMVEMRRDLRYDKVWLTGALLRQELSGIEALIKKEANDLFLYIKTADKAHRAHTYLNTLRSVLDAIHRDMGLKQPKVLVAYTEGGQTEYFSYNKLEGARKAGHQTEYSEVFDRSIPIDAILNGSDSRIAEEKERLLKDLAEICLRLRCNRRMNDASEDDRNDEFRDALRYKGYRVSDQTHVGRGKTGKRAGSLDLQLLHEGDLPWTSIEAMNLHSASKDQLQYWDNHLDRLMDHYDPAGLPTLFLVSYVSCKAENYHKLFSAYAEHMRTYQPSKSELRHSVPSEVLPLTEQHGYVRVLGYTYDRSGTPVTVYHYFVGFTEDSSCGE